MNTIEELYQVAEIEITYKRKEKANTALFVQRSKDAYDVLLNAWDKNKIDYIEQSKMLLLSNSSQVLGICNISTGGVTGTVIDPRVVFAVALKTNASSIILAHNHPSGNLVPSAADIRMTDKLTEAGKLLDIRVLDHLIVASEGFYSFSNELTCLNEQDSKPLIDFDF